MNIKLFPKAQLESLWNKTKANYIYGVEPPPLCLRCGQPLCSELASNARSRYIDVSICSSCGTDEALRDAQGQLFPLLDWQAVKNGLPELDIKGPLILLTPVCSFPKVFEQTKKEGNSALPYPISEVVYSRSDYDGYRWWSKWFDCQKERPSKILCREIDQFHNALFRMPEFKTLDTMYKLCRCAQPTSSSSEFNLYSETEHFFIWLRLITRFRDYNLYVHYYAKQV